MGNQGYTKPNPNARPFCEASGRDSKVKVTKRAESLEKFSVATPPNVVGLMWHLVRGVRKQRGTTLDMGAGDLRFAVASQYTRYLGVDVQPIDAAVEFPARAEFRQDCISQVTGKFDVVIGNPPYLKHQAIDPEWRDQERAFARACFDLEISSLANMYVYFIIRALSLVKKRGVVCLLVPTDWLGRPSAKPVVDYLIKQKLYVDVYEFTSPKGPFPSVLTTACIMRIAMGKKRHGIQVHQMDPTQGGATVKAAPLTALNGNRVKFDRRGHIYAHRGLSPGSQKVFCLTEKERTHAKIPVREVSRCVTTLRPLPNGERLTRNAWAKHYQKAGERCWLLKTDRDISAHVQAWLDAAPEEIRSNWTCTNREPWYSYPQPEPPQILYSPGFVSKAPQLAKNEAQAIAVGSAAGIRHPSFIDSEPLLRYMKELDLRDRVIPMAKGFRKLEVRQMNSLLNEWARSSGAPKQELATP